MGGDNGHRLDLAERQIETGGGIGKVGELLGQCRPARCGMGHLGRVELPGVAGLKFVEGGQARLGGGTFTKKNGEELISELGRPRSVSLTTCTPQAAEDRDRGSGPGLAVSVWNTPE